MKTIFQAIERALIVEMDVTFNNIAGNIYEIRVKDMQGNERYVRLPIGDHLNEEKMVKYINLLIDDLLQIDKNQTEAYYRQGQIEFFANHLTNLNNNKHRLEPAFYESEKEAVNKRISELQNLDFQKQSSPKKEPHLD